MPNLNLPPQGATDKASKMSNCKTLCDFKTLISLNMYVGDMYNMALTLLALRYKLGEIIMGKQACVLKNNAQVSTKSALHTGEDYQQSVMNMDSSC